MSKDQKNGGQQPKWCRLVAGSPKKAVFWVSLIGLVFGILFWGALNTALEYTNRQEFCLGCHEMTIPYEEYKKTVHYSNRTGTTVTCADCHVPSSKTPGDYGRKVWRKIEAARDIVGHITGVIDTKEKFEAHRLTMAQREWDRMKKADSQECRNCHKFETMRKDKQKKRSVRKHEEAIEDKLTCIECHKGIAHKPVHIAQAGGSAADDKDADDADKAAPAAEPAAPDASPATPAPAAPAGMSGMSGMPGMAGSLIKTAGANPVDPAAPATPASPGAIDWTKVPTKTVPVFYPGQAALEWVWNKPDHSSANQLLEKGRTCTYCHDEDANEIGTKIAAGKPVGNAKAVLDAAVPQGVRGSVPVTIYAAHDSKKMYLRFEWEAKKSNGGPKGDPKNEVKLAVMFDDNKVEGSKSNGCWSTCHMDLRTMPDTPEGAKDHEKAKALGWSDGVTKYIKESRADLEMKSKPRGGWDKFKSDEEISAALKAGKFMDLIQFRSGKGEKPVDGYVLDARYMNGGKSLTKAEGRREGNKWVVIFERNLAAVGKGDHTFAKGKQYNFGFAIHEGFTNARFHNVSLGYTLALDDDQAFINVVKQ